MKTTLLLITTLLSSTFVFSEITANYHNGNVEISWSQSNNQKTSYFLIERSNNGRSFTSLSKVEGGKLGVDYFEIDYQPPSKYAFYRITQVSEYGKICHSETILVKDYNKISRRTNKTFLKNYKNENVLIVIKNKKGEEFHLKASISAYKNDFLAISNDYFVKIDTYTIIATSDDVLLNKKVTIIGNKSSNETFLSEN